jgi:hypothetical protein
MTIDISAWKTNDPKWVKSREEKWPIFERWANNEWRNTKEKVNLAERFRSAKLFYFTGTLHQNVHSDIEELSFEVMLALLAAPAPDQIRCLVDSYDIRYKGLGFKGAFSSFYLGLKPYEALIEKGALPADFRLTVLKGLYGSSLAEAAQILEFDVKGITSYTFDLLADALLNFYLRGESKVNSDVAHYLLPFLLDMFVVLNDKVQQEVGRLGDAIAILKSDFYDKKSVTDPVRVAYFEQFLAGLRERLPEIGPVLREKLLPIFQ